MITTEGLIKRSSGSQRIQVLVLDGTSTKLLKITKEYSALTFALTFEQSLDTGVIPEDCKLAYVVPIFDSGD